MPANPSPAPEVLTKLAEIEYAIAWWLDSPKKYESAAWLCRELRDALTALAAEQESGRAVYLHSMDLEQALAAATREAEILRGLLTEAEPIVALPGKMQWDMRPDERLELLSRIRAALAPRSPEGEKP